MMTSTKDIYTIDPDFYRSYTKEERERHNSQTLTRLLIWTVALVALMFAVYTWMNGVKDKDITPLSTVKYNTITTNNISEKIVPTKPKVVIAKKKETFVPLPKILKSKPIIVQKIEKKVEVKTIAIIEKKPKLKIKKPVDVKIKSVTFDELSPSYIEAVRKALGK